LGKKFGLKTENAAAAKGGTQGGLNRKILPEPPREENQRKYFFQFGLLGLFSG